MLRVMFSLSHTNAKAIRYTTCKLACMRLHLMFGLSSEVLMNTGTCAWPAKLSRSWVPTPVLRIPSVMYCLQAAPLRFAPQTDTESEVFCVESLDLIRNRSYLETLSLKIPVVVFKIVIFSYVCVYACVRSREKIHEIQKDIGFPGTGVTGGYDCLISTLGTEPRSHAGAVRVLNHRTTSPASVNGLSVA